MHHNILKLKSRIDALRPIQALFLRYRYNRVKSTREYPYKLKYVTNPSYRLYGSQIEILYYLLEDYVETKHYQDKHNVLSKSLICNIYSLILAISKLDY